MSIWRKSFYRMSMQEPLCNLLFAMIRFRPCDNYVWGEITWIKKQDVRIWRNQKAISRLPFKFTVIDSRVCFLFYISPPENHRVIRHRSVSANCMFPVYILLMSSMHLNSSKHLQNSELIYVNDYKPTLNSISRKLAQHWNNRLCSNDLI